MNLAVSTPNAKVFHAALKGRALCGANAPFDAAPAQGRPCKSCITVMEKGYQRLPVSAEHWLWDCWARVAQQVNANWGPFANPVLLDRVERAEWEELLLSTLERPDAPANLRWVRTMSDTQLMLEAERATASTS